MCTDVIRSVLWHCWLGYRKGICPVKRWVLVCCWWFQWSFVCFIAPVVTITSNPPSSLAPIKPRMETFWYQLTEWPLERRQRYIDICADAMRCASFFYQVHCLHSVQIKSRTKLNRNWIARRLNESHQQTTKWQNSLLLGHEVRLDNHAAAQCALSTPSSIRDEQSEAHSRDWLITVGCCNATLLSDDDDDANDQATNLTEYRLLRVKFQDRFM